MVKNPQINILEFVGKSPAELEIRVLAGEKGLTNRFILSERIQKLGLAFAGFTHYIQQGRIQIIGRNEISYLDKLSGEERTEVLSRIELEKVCCILITKNLEISKELIKIADKSNLPILRTPLVSSKAISLTTVFLQTMLAPETSLHGVLMEIHGIGVLLTGESGIGKSECALDLISRGHRLVADDVVTIKRIGTRLDGESPELIFEHLEIRGLGIVNVRDLFGVSAINRRQAITLCIELKKWKLTDEIERIGLEMREEEVLGLKIPKFVLPVSSGRNLSTLVETAVRVHLLKCDGYDAAKKLIEKHSMIVGGN